MNYARIYFYFIGAFIVFMFLPIPGMWSSFNGYITAYHPMVQQSLFWMAGLLVVGLLIFSIYCIVEKKGRLGKILLWTLLALVIALIAISWQGVRQLFSAGWYEETRIQAPDKHVYGVLGFSMMQAREGYLCRLVEDNGIKRRWAILAQTNYDWPETWAFMVRPVGFQKDGEKFFYLDGRLFYFMGSHYCKMSYDLNRGEEQGVVDPFILIGPNDELNEEDVKDITYHTTHPKGRGYGPVPPSALRKGLDHPNPRVRALAQSLLTLAQENPVKDKDLIIEE